MKTVAENFTALSLIRPKSITATETGSGVDVDKYGDDCIGIVHFGALGGTTETFIAKVQTSVIGDFTDAVDALVFGTVTGSNGDNLSAAGRVNLSGVKKIRGVITMSGSSASLVSMSCLVRNPNGGAGANSATPA